MQRGSSEAKVTTARRLCQADRVPTVVQLSDLHLQSDPDARLRGLDTRRSLARVLAAVDRDVPDVDCFVLTGDLAHDERAETYGVLKEMLGSRLVRCRFVPGNHDTPSAIAAAFPDDSSMDGRATFVADFDGWRLIGLDSHVPGKNWGRIDDEQLGWLGQQLDEAGDRNVALFVHHPPVGCGTLWLDRIALKQPQAFVRLVERHDQVLAVFHGHIHHESEGSVGQTRVLAAPSTCFQFQPGTWLPRVGDAAPAYRLIELTDGLRTSVHRVDELARPDQSTASAS